MELKFEYEYDGTVYEVEVEYKVIDASYDHAFGTEKASYADAVAFTTYVNGAKVILTDKELISLLWNEADKQGDKAVKAYHSEMDYAL